MIDSPRILYMGTPAFAVPVLDALYSYGYNICSVITAPDKPAGRGRHIRFSAVKEYALAHHLPILQPERLSDPVFVSNIQELQPDLAVVVAFRMLPELIWSIPSLGTINLHASLLPAYRGAAPINWALINGEKQTGITTFFIDKGLDTGSIIDQEFVEVGEDMNAGELHDLLMQKGTQLVLKTVRRLLSGKLERYEQSLDKVDLPRAPKLSRQDGRIQWTRSARDIHNLVRGLSPYPGAWAEVKSPDNEVFILKILRGKPIVFMVENGHPGSIIRDKDRLIVQCQDAGYEILEAQWPARRRMTVKDLLLGSPIDSRWFFL